MENKNKNTGGRPPKNEEDKAIYFLKIRVSKAEKERIKEKALEHNLSISAYVKLFALRGKMTYKKSSLSPYVRTHFNLLKNIGDNLNKIARKELSNSPMTLEEKNALREYLINWKNKIIELERKILEDDSKY